MVKKGTCTRVGHAFLGYPDEWNLVPSYFIADLETRRKLASAGSTWGKIIPIVDGNREKTAQRFREVVAELTPPKLVLVGDVITDSCAKVGLEADLAIVDGKTRRGFFSGGHGLFDDIESVENPPGEIRGECWDLVSKVLKGTRRCIISVNGEEDLLAIPAILEAPASSVVAFGQPPKTDADPPLPEGIAYIVVTGEVQKAVTNLVDSFKVA
ncbi:MAG: hypothetical protein Kow0069_30130 [Promethearchaeota archaeon]